MTIPNRPLTSSTTTQKRNRRLRYLSLHPETLEPQRSSSTVEDRIGGPISANLLDAYDIDQRIEARKTMEREKEREARENALLEEEDDDDSDEEKEEEVERSSLDESHIDSRENQRKEAVESFLAGELQGFDYDSVDNDDTLDDLKIIHQDAQERFFDEEVSNSPEDHSDDHDKDESEELQGQTGIQDY